ncbi:hypothetical protein [Phocoenobacter skyensis]|uniref:hypothetical protein n=1 Tax=Phocoenobacter skyensis TaxID=97481 RepID=UPI0027686ED0|nr:hypothetical protein [Pasteurella skyensis]MDP8185293.1 hypothetical protein [Pasteurella skyensis]
MSNKEAYCVELGRVVNIIEARLEFLSQNKLNKFTFLCSNEECRNNGVKIIGVNYNKYPSEETKLTPHFKYRSKNNKPHSSNCMWNQNKDIKKHKNESNDEFKLRKTKLTLNDYIDIFETQSPSKDNHSTSIIDKITTENNSIKTFNQKQNNKTEKPIKKHTKTNQLMRLVESYLNARAKLPKELFLKLPLKTPQKEITYLYQYFRRAEKAIIEKKICVYIGDTEFKENDKGLYFILKNQEADKTDKSNKIPPIVVFISRDTFDKYRYRRALRDHINTNQYPKKYFKVYFIPEKEQLNLRKKEKNGKVMEFYFIEIKNLHHFCLFNYSTIKNLRK